MKFLYLIIGVLCASCSTSNQIVVVDNSLDFDRSSEIVEIPISDIRLNSTKGKVLIVKNSEGEIIPTQISYDEKLLFVPSVGANMSAEYTLSLGDVVDFEPRVGGHVHADRYDDFAWENDRVGFRFYGNALKSVDGPSNGLDLWYKRTDKLVLDQWYKKNLSGEASYHVDHGEGCDPYAVGRTLGAGNMAPFVNDTLWLNENYMTAEILDNGPLRLTFRLTYPEMEVDGKAITESKTISLDAGSQLTKIVQEFGNSGKAMKVAAGVVKRPDNDSIIINSEHNYFIYQDPMTEKNGQIYVGVLIPQGISNVLVNNYTYKHTLSGNVSTLSNVLAVTNYEPNMPVTYYTGFGWNKSGFETVNKFDAYMNQYSQKIKYPLTVTNK